MENLGTYQIPSRDPTFAFTSGQWMTEVNVYYSSRIHFESTECRDSDQEGPTFP